MSTACEKATVPWTVAVPFGSSSSFSGSAAQGGSTIAQQLVKNLYTGDAQDLRRKIDEAAVVSIDVEGAVVVGPGPEGAISPR